MGSRVEIWDTAKWLENNAELDMEQVTGALLGRETII
jgi:hypothetical protein